MNVLSTLALALGLLSSPAALFIPPTVDDAGKIVFYEGNNKTQDKLFTLKDDKTQGYNLKDKKSPGPNDEIRSLVLENVRAGTVIKLYDDPKGRTHDDYCTIYVLKSKPEYVIKHLEMKSFRDDYVKFDYKRHNGLNGKVSHVRIMVPRKK